MRSRLVSLSIIGALILSACGGSDSTTTRLRNSAANCFDTAEAQRLAVDTARSNLRTAESAVMAAGDKAALDSELAAVTTVVSDKQQEYDRLKEIKDSAERLFWDLVRQGYMSATDEADKETFAKASSEGAAAIKAADALLLPLNRAKQRQSAAQRAVDAWFAAASSVSQGQTALSTAESTQLCASDEVVAADDTTDAADDAADDTTDAADDLVDDTTDAADDSADDTTDAADDSADDTTDAADDSADDSADDTNDADDTTNADDTTTNEDQVDDSTNQDSTTGDDDGGDVNAAVEAPEEACAIVSLEVPGQVAVGEFFEIVAVYIDKETRERCFKDQVIRHGGELDVANITSESNIVVWGARALLTGQFKIEVGFQSSDEYFFDVWHLLVVDPALVGTTDDLCEGLKPEVKWNDDQNGSLFASTVCENSVRLDIEFRDDQGRPVWSGQFGANSNPATAEVFDVRSVFQSDGVFTYSAWHMCTPSDARTSNDWYLCGEVTEGEVSSGPPEDSSGSGDPALPTVPVGLFTPVVNPPAGSVDGSTQPIQIAIDPAVVILVCDRDCVADVAQRAGVDVTAVGDDGPIADALVEMRIDDGEWGVALGGFIPVDNGLVSAEFRVTPIKGEPVTFAADLYGNGAPLRETVSVDSSGDVVDSSGQTVARIPVFEVVAEEGGSPVLLIVLILLALLVAVLVAAFVMKKQRAKLNTSDSSSSV
jgi:hypothetical protein